MSGVKLVDKSTNSLVDVDPGQVGPAIDSGKFAFDKKRNYPIIHNGEPQWVPWDYAAKYRDRVDFTTDDEVKTFNAQQSMKGVLPKLGAAAYGAGTALTLGALPLAIETLGGERGKGLVETVERGAPGYVLGGELAGSLVDPFAAAERLGARLGGKAATTAARELAPEVRAGIEAAGAKQVAATYEPGLQLGREAKETAAKAAETQLGAESLARGLRPGELGPAEEFGATREAAAGRKWSQIGDINASIEEESSALARTMKSLKRAKSEKTVAKLEAEKEATLGRLNELSLQRAVTETHGAREAADIENRAAMAELMQGEAPAWQAEAARLGEQAKGLEEAAAAQPRLGELAPTRQLAPEQLAGLEPLGAAQAAESLAPRRMLSPTAAMAAQTGAYGTLRQLGKQEAGLEEGGLPEALAAGALGAAAVPALGLGAKGVGAVGKAVAPSATERLGGLLKKGAESLEEASILRAWGVTPGQAGKVQRMFYNPEAEALGSRELSDFIRGKLAQVEELKALPETAKNINLQSIRVDRGLRGMSEEQRYAFAHELNNALNRERAGVFEQVGNPTLTESDLGKLVSHAVPAKGTAGKGVTEITPFVRELEGALKGEESFTLRDLQQMKTAFGQQMEQMHTTNPWRKEELAFYGELKNLIQQKVGEANPELLAQLQNIDKQSTFAIEIEKGIQSLAKKHALTQVVGPDLASQVALGAFAMNRPISAIKFGLGAAALRAINLHRGDGIMADLSGNFAKKVATNPAIAAQDVTKSILTSKSPAMLGVPAEHFVHVTSESYGQISQLVRQLQDQRDQVKADIQSRLASMPPAEAQALTNEFDAKINALAAAQPKGLATEAALTEQQKNYVIFARGVIDPAYAVQVLLNGKDGTEAAARALQATPNGVQMLGNIQQQFKQALDENAKLRGDKNFVEIARTFQKASSKGGAFLQIIHRGAAAEAPQGAAPAPRVGASAQKAAASSLASVYSPAPRVQ